MSIVEICDSVYSHTPINSLDKVYLKHRFKNKIICEECLSAYLDDVSVNLACDIFNCIKNVDMKSMIVSPDIERADNFSFTYENELFSKYMQYILPIKFKLNISFVNETLQNYMTSDYLSISTHTNAPITAVRIARANISSIVCDSSYPSFNLSLDIRETDTEEIISSRIADYLENFVLSFFKEIPNNIVQSIMNRKSSGKYFSNCSNSSTNSPSCTGCNINISKESYSYNNRMYCLNCMYEIVVDLAVSNNLSDLVSLSDTENSTICAIVNNDDWKRSVIDKYINAMTSYGARPNIIHYTIV